MQNVIFKDFICLHNRDDFLSKELVKDRIFSYKNFDFNDFDLTIKQIKLNNLIPVRIGMHIVKRKNKELDYLDLLDPK